MNPGVVGRRLLVLLLVSFALFGVAIAVITPAGKFPDEWSHLAYIRFVRAHHQLPPVGVTPSEMPVPQGFQPPLYYGLAALLPPFAGEVNILWTRCLSILLGVLAILIVWRTAYLVFPDDLPAAVLSCSFVAFTPRFLYTCAGIGNLPMTALTCSLTLYWLVKLIRSDSHLLKRCVAMGICFGLAMLSRPTAVYLAPVCIAGIAYRIWKGKEFSWVGLIRQAVVFFAAAFLICGWWYVRNWILYGDPVLWNVVRETAGAPWMRTEPPSAFYMLKQIAFLHASYWAYFGEAEFHAGIWEYAVYLLLMGLAAVGLFEILVGRAKNNREYGTSSFVLWLFVSACVIAIAEILIVQIRMDAPEGRYLYMAISPFSILLAAGLAKVIPSSYRKSGSLAISSFLFLFCIYLLLSYWLPHFI